MNGIPLLPCYLHYTINVQTVWPKDTKQKKIKPPVYDTVGVDNTGQKTSGLMRVGFEPTRIAPPGYCIKVTLT